MGPCGWNWSSETAEGAGPRRATSKTTTTDDSVAGAAITLVFMLVVYAVAFGLHRPRLQRVGPNSDASLLDRAPMSFGGVLGALITGTTLSSFSLQTPWTRGNVLTLIAIVAIVTAFAPGGSSRRNGLHTVRELIYFLIGASAAALLVLELASGACGAQLPSRIAVVFIVIPAVLVLLSSMATAVVFLRPMGTARNAGRTVIAAVMVLELGIVAVYPGGAPLLGQSTPALGGWLPLVLWLFLVVIALGVGVHPRAGADLTAIGLLVLKVYFGLGPIDATCGLSIIEAFWVTAVFFAVFLGGLVVRSMLRR